MSSEKNRYIIRGRKLKEKTKKLIKHRISSIRIINQLKDKPKLNKKNSTIKGIGLLVWATGVHYGMLRCMKTNNKIDKNLKYSFNTENKIFMKKRLIILRNISKINKSMTHHINETRIQKLREETVILWNKAYRYGEYKMCLIKLFMNKYSSAEIEKKLFSFEGKSNKAIQSKYRFVKNESVLCYTHDNKKRGNFDQIHFENVQPFGYFTAEQFKLPSSMEAIDNLTKNLCVIQSKIESLREHIKTMDNENNILTTNNENSTLLKINESRKDIILDQEKNITKVPLDENDFPVFNTDIDKNKEIDEINSNCGPKTSSHSLEKQILEDDEFLSFENSSSGNMLDNMEWNLNIAELEIINLLLEIRKQKEFNNGTSETISSTANTSEFKNCTSEIRKAVKLCKCFSESISLICNNNTRSTKLSNFVDNKSIIDKIKYFIIKEFCFNHLCPELLNENKSDRFITTSIRKYLDRENSNNIKMCLYNQNESESDKNNSVYMKMIFKCNNDKDTYKLLINKGKILKELAEISKNDKNTKKNDAFIFLSDRFRLFKDMKMPILKFTNSYTKNKIKKQNDKFEIFYKIKRLINIIHRYFLKININIYLYKTKMEKLHKKRKNVIKRQYNVIKSDESLNSISEANFENDSTHKMTRLKSKAFTLSNNSITRSTISQDVLKELCSFSDDIDSTTSNDENMNRASNCLNFHDSKKANQEKITIHNLKNIFSQENYEDQTCKTKNIQKQCKSAQPVDLEIHIEKDIEGKISETTEFNDISLTDSISCYMVMNETEPGSIEVDTTDLKSGYKQTLKNETLLLQNMNHLKMSLKRESMKINDVFFHIDYLNYKVNRNADKSGTAVDNLYEQFNSLQDNFESGLTSNMIKLKCLSLKQTKITRQVNKKIKDNSKNIKRNTLQNKKIRNMLRSEIILNEDKNKDILKKLGFLHHKLNTFTDFKEQEMNKLRKTEIIFRKKVKIKVNETIHKIKMMGIKLQSLERINQNYYSKENKCNHGAELNDFNSEKLILNEKLEAQQQIISSLVDKINNTESWLLKVVSNIQDDYESLSNRLDSLEHNLLILFNQERETSDNVSNLKNGLYKNSNYLLKCTKQVQFLQRSIQVNRSFLKCFFDEYKETFDGKINTNVSFNSDYGIFDEHFIDELTTNTNSGNEELLENISKKRELSKITCRNIKKLSSKIDITVNNVETKVEGILANLHNIDQEHKPIAQDKLMEKKDMVIYKFFLLSQNHGYI